jgi:hypothetical protein
MDQTVEHDSAQRTLLRPSRGIKWAILAGFLLPLFSIWFYFNLFLDGLHGDYWTRNQRYPLLALSHDLGSIGLRVTFFSAVLACILLAYLGVKRFGRPGDAPFHRLLLVVMCLPLATAALVSFPPLLPDTVAIPLFLGSLLLNGLLLIGWGVVRREAFRRAMLYLLPWLGLLVCVLTPALGNLLYPPLDNTPPGYLGVALGALLSVPLFFALAMAVLRLDTRTQIIVLMVVTVEALGMALVQLMMGMRLLTLTVLGLSTYWSSELIVTLGLNVLATALALVCVLLSRPWRRSPAPPIVLAEGWVVEPLS